MHDFDPVRAGPTDDTPAAPAALNPNIGPPAPDAEHTTDDENSFLALKADITALVDDARNYTQAEIGFQKTRIGLVGKRGAHALGSVVLALVLLHIALIALAVGVVIALAPSVTFWGAIAIVVGVLLAGVMLLVWSAMGDSRVIKSMFDAGDDS